MRKEMILLAGAAALPYMPGIAHADDTPVHSFAGKVAAYSEYEYRGIAQSSEKPAFQLNLDYAHRSGFYLGTFLSTIKWLKDMGDVFNTPMNANLEWDLYGGYKFEVAKDWTLDVGYLRYEYPSSKAIEGVLVKPDTDEVYAGISYGPATLKYSYSLNEIFGVPHSKGSDYLELSVNYPVTGKVTLNGVLGHQRYKGTQPLANNFNNADFSYTVWKAGATYDFGHGLSAGAYYKGTDADPIFFTFKGKDWSKDRVVGFVAYSF